jgi:hypothetical protein
MNTQSRPNPLPPGHWCRANWSTEVTFRETGGAGRGSHNSFLENAASSIGDHRRSRTALASCNYLNESSHHPSLTKQTIGSSEYYKVLNAAQLVVKKTS